MYQFANSFIPVRDSWVNERNLSMVERDSEYSMSAKSWLIYSGRRTPVIMAFTLGFSITDDLAKEAKEICEFTWRMASTKVKRVVFDI